MKEETQTKRKIIKKYGSKVIADLAGIPVGKVWAYTRRNTIGREAYQKLHTGIYRIASETEKIKLKKELIVEFFGGDYK